MRPERLEGKTYKAKVTGNVELTFYVTINFDITGMPYEMFVNVKDSQYWEHLTMMSTMVSKMLQAGIDPCYIADSLRQLESPKTNHIVPGIGFVPSIYARIGMILEHSVVGDDDE